VGGIPEAIQDDINGLLVSRNSESLAKAIARLYDHPMEHARLGCEGRRLFLRTFELSQIVRKYHALYVDCIKEQILSRS
jgi:glycosyltransferase involved in cell wall biosynthesis